MTIRVLAHAGGGTSDERQRRREPLSFGVPLPPGSVRDGASWKLLVPASPARAVQVRALDRWADGSIRWALVDVQANLDGEQVQELLLEVQDDAANTEEEQSAVTEIVESANGVIVDTRAARFHVRPGGGFPFDKVEVNGQAVLQQTTDGLTITDADGVQHRAEIRGIDVEERGPLRSVVRLIGVVALGRRRLDLAARIHFFAGLPTVRLLVTLKNPDRARHAGGFWDLGDPGSLLIKDASLSFHLPASIADVELYASPEVGAPWAKFDTPFELYQDSSGGDNWQSSNHLNRERRVPSSFRGYRLRAGGRAQTGLRATPIVGLARGAAGVALTTQYFWQNFPKAVEATETALIVRLFPGQHGDAHEIQGGEQKTHELFIAFGPDGVTSVPLAWARTRTVAGAAPEWCRESGAVPFLAPLDPEHAALVNTAIEGRDSFERKREKIDEYGWRHFGEIYGDHEAVQHKGATPLVSHYNNQYDPVAGFAYQYLRTGDPRWWAMMTELATHVIDIDIYHTTRDKWAYNHGMFWHTYHYGDADTATHRSYPRAGQGHIHGGGPAAGHNYATGLMFHHFLTGDESSREAVIQLAQFVVDLDDGRKTIFRWVDRGDTGRAVMSYEGYCGPGRGAANSLDALMSGYRLRGGEPFRRKVEQLIQRVVHPRDDIARWGLDIPEDHWYYTMFLQALGRYLDAKAAAGEMDSVYAYARASLMHYSRWMADHEYPYLEKPEKLFFPTETWAAQDIRKSDVFHLAALHATGDERARLLERATFFYESSVKSLQRMPTRTLARPVIVLLSSGFLHAWSRTRPAAGPAVDLTSAERFGEPAVFVSQRERVKQRLPWIAAAGAVGFLGLIAVLLFR